MNLLSRKELFESTVKDLFRDTHIGDLWVHAQDLTRLPDDLPDEVKGNFSCSHNKLTSLEGSPTRVDGEYRCVDNKLTSLVGGPEYVGATFFCMYNKLTSLEGAPKEVGGSFRCGDQTNGHRFTEADVRAVCNVKGKIYV